MRLDTGYLDARDSSATAMQLIEDLIVVTGIAVVNPTPLPGRSLALASHLVQGGDTNLARGRDKR